MFMFIYIFIIFISLLVGKYVFDYVIEQDNIRKEKGYLNPRYVTLFWPIVFAFISFLISSVVILSIFYIYDACKIIVCA